MLLACGFLHVFVFLGTGVPQMFVSNRQNFNLPLGSLPDVQHAVMLYRQSGGNLTDESVVGKDLLFGYPILQAQRDVEVTNLIMQHIGPPDVIFGFASNHSYWQIQHSISLHISISERMYNSI